MKKDREPSYSPLRSWVSPSILPLVNIHYGSNSATDRRSVDTILTPSDRYSRGVTSPPRGGIVDPVVVNAGLTFRLTDPKATYIHNHVHVDPASTVTKTASSYLSKEIDKFLKKSDHSLDRFQKLWKGKTTPPKEIPCTEKRAPPLPKKIPSIEKGTPVPQETCHQDSLSPCVKAPPKPQESPSPSVKAPPKPLRLFYTDKNSSSSEHGAASPHEHGVKLNTQEPKLSIAEQAERHRQILSRVMNSAGAGGTKGEMNGSSSPQDTETLRPRSSISSSSSSGSSSDDLDGTFEDAVVFDGDLRKPEKSDDTSAEISKLEDLSSESDDEFFDVQPLPGYFHIPGRQHIRPTGVVQTPLMPVSSISRPSIPNRFPIHSYSLPTVNKLHPSTRMGNKQPMSNTSSQGMRGYKKYPAPPPPVSREASLLSLSSETNRSSLDESTLNTSIDSSSLNGDLNLESLKKKIRRNPSLKKYPAPPPPISGDSQKTPVNGGDVSTPPGKKDSVQTYPDTKISIDKVSKPTEKPSPDCTRKVGNMRPGSPVPFRSAMFPLGKSNSTNISHCNADINFSVNHSSKKNTSSNATILNNKLENSVVSKCNNSQISNSALSTPNNTSLAQSKDTVSSETTSNPKYNSLTLSGNKELSSSVSITSSIISSSSNIENSDSYPTFSNDLSSSQNVPTISSSVDVTSIQSSCSVSTKAFNSSNSTVNSAISTVNGTSSTVNSSSSTVLSVDTSSTSVLKNNISNSVECQDDSKKTVGEKANLLNAAPTQPLEGKLEKEILTNGELENKDKKQPSKLEGVPSKNPSSEIGNTSSSLKQEENRESASTTLGSKELEATTDTTQDPKDNTEIKTRTNDSKQSEVSTDSSAQDKPTKKVKKKKVSSDKNSTLKNGGDERRSRSSSVTSSRSITPDKGLRPVPRKSISGKLAALTTKFEVDESAEKNLINPSKKTLGLGGIFSSDKSETKGKVIGKLSSPYSKPFSPESTIKEKKSNIGGIDISKFGGFGKPKKMGKKEEERDQEKKDEKENKTESSDKKEEKKRVKGNEKEISMNNDTKIESLNQDTVTEDMKRKLEDKEETKDKEKSKPNKAGNEKDEKKLIKASDNGSNYGLEIGKNETMETEMNEGLNENIKERNEILLNDPSQTVSESDKQNQSSTSITLECPKADEQNSVGVLVQENSEIIKDNRNQTEVVTNQESEPKKLSEKIEEKLDGHNNSLIHKKDEDQISGSISSDIVHSEEKSCKELPVEGKEIDPSCVLPAKDTDKSEIGTTSDINQPIKVIETEAQELNIVNNLNECNAKTPDNVEKLSITKSSEEEASHNIPENKPTLDIDKSDIGTTSSGINQPIKVIETEAQELNIVKNLNECNAKTPDNVEKLSITKSSEEEASHNIPENKPTLEVLESKTAENQIIQPDTTSNEIKEGTEQFNVKNTYESDIKSPIDLDQTEKPSITKSTESESTRSVGVSSQSESTSEIIKIEAEAPIIQEEAASNKKEENVLPIEKCTVSADNHDSQTSSEIMPSCVIQISTEAVKSEGITQESESTRSVDVSSQSESTPIIQQEAASNKKEENVSPIEKCTVSADNHDIQTSSEIMPSCDIQISTEAVKSEGITQESTAAKSENQSLSVEHKPVEEVENTELQSLLQNQMLSEKSLCIESDTSFSTYRPSVLTPIPEASLPGSPVLPDRDISVSVTDSAEVEANKVLPGNSVECKEFIPGVEHGIMKDVARDDNCQLTLPKAFIDFIETSGETFGKFEDSCSTGSFGTPPSDRASSDEMFIYEPRILSETNAESIHATSYNDIDHSKGVTSVTSETDAPPLSIPYVKQFIDMSRSPSERIHTSHWMPQKSTSLLQKVSDLFQTLVSKESKGNPPSSVIPAVNVTQDHASVNEIEREPDTLDAVRNIPNFTHFNNETPLYSYKREETQTTQPPAIPKFEGLTPQNQLSVRPKTRRTARGSSIPAEVLNVSEIIRDADERLSRALSKSASSLNSGLERLRSDSPTHPIFYDPSRFDTLMPLPNADEINMVDKARSRSMTPFMDRFERSPTPKRVMEETEALLTETDRILRKTRSQHSLRRSFAKSLSGANLNRLTEVTADLSEEHSTAHLASERIEAEQSERMRLEEEVSQLQMEVKRMTSLNGKLEMEKLTLRNEVLQHVEVNGDVIGDDEEGGGGSDASLYKRKYEWAMREVEVLKKQLKQQQEDDLDQLLVLKKQLEKKVTDAYEETDEQRQVVAQMKKKSQRLQAEMNDMKILLEEQTSRNNLLEKKQRKFDQEMQSVVEEQRNERLAKEKIQRERDQVLSEKYSFEQEVSTLKLELELKEEKIASLSRELSDLNFTGKSEEEVAVLKKAKHDLELKVKDQEEELDDLAGQVQMLEAARIRLEMSIEQTRKENRREIAQRDEEMEETRVSAQKKIKALEAQLESEHDERTSLVREKHDLERRLVDAHSRSFTSVDEDAFHRVKKELKKTKALLKDTQTMLEKTQSEGSNKLLMRQLKTQLEDAEFAKNAAIKARQSAESDFSELQSQLDEALRAKKDTEDKLARVTKEKSEVQTQLEESEEEVAEVMKKYKATVSQLSVDQVNMSEQAQLIADLEHDKQVLQDRLSELSSKVEVLEGETANIHTQRRLQMKIKELESKLDLELTTRQRLESQISRLKDQVEKVSAECDSIRLKEMQAVDHGKKLSRQLREAKEDSSNLQQRVTDSTSRKQEIEKQYELAESEIMTLKSDLKLAFKRIEDLQQALQGDISDSDTEMSESTSHDMRIRDVVVGGASMMTSIREEGGKESFA